MKRSEDGFSITECVMALVVLSAASIGLLETVPKARQNAAEAADRAYAASLAAQIISAAERGEGTLTGIDETGRFTWQSEVLPVRDNYSGYLLSVRVSWRSHDRPVEYRTQSYRWAEQ